MSLLQNSNAISTGGAYNLESSLRFRDSASSYLSRTPTTVGNRKTWTWSGWVKRGALDVGAQQLFSSNSGSAPWFGLWLVAANNLEVSFGSGATAGTETTQLFRDPSAWYHIVVAIDTTQATASNRVKIYINGEQITSFSNTNYPAQNFDTQVNYTYPHTLGNSNYAFDGYMTEVNFIDGQALTPSDFGSYDGTTGVWKPKKYTGTYGTNGFYLPMKETQQATGFNTVLWTGNGGTQSITGVGFSPDLVWYKCRSNSSTNHIIIDSVRGTSKYLSPNQTIAEGTVTNTITSFDNDGFSLGSDGSGNFNGRTNVGWCWDAGSSTVSNTDGTITSSVRANPATGFSIVTYTVPSGGASFTVGHGLGVAPSMIITKNRGGTSPFPTWFTGFSKDEYVNLNTTAAKASQTDYWGSAVPTSTVFGNKEGVTWNAGANIVAYCFSEVAGYSKFGSYTGTGATGNTITTGFRPAFVMIKRTDSIGNWIMIDNIRSVNNPKSQWLNANTSDAEGTSSASDIDFDDNGFTLQNTNADRNGSGNSYIYMAFADTRDAQFNFDASGNKNNWTANNINSNASSETTYDIMNDVATLTDEDTANFCTLNPLHAGDDITASEANLKWVSSSTTGMDTIVGTIGVNSGKWYWETTIVNQYTQVGICGELTDSQLQTNFGAASTGYGYNAGGTKRNNGSDSAYGASFTAGDTLGIALDLDGGTLTFYKNGVSQGTAYTGLSGLFFPAFADYTTAYVGGSIANFGQRPFAYTPPTGYKKLNTYNLPDSTIVDGSQYMNPVLYTGNGGTQSITGVGFSPDLVWVKSRNTASYWHNLVDTVRGNTKYLFSNDTTGETTQTTYLTSFDSDGFSIGSNANWNNSGTTYVAWNWRGSDSSAVSNTDGTITSTVSANTDSGFSVVTYTSTGTAGATVGHGLGVAPKVVIVKIRNAGGGWVVGHTDMSSNYDYYIKLESTGARTNTENAFNDTAPTSSVFTLGSWGQVNSGGIYNYVAYCFAEVEGFSKIGSYTGNGSTDGPFVYTGFRPAFVMVKASSRTGQWLIYDVERDSYNVMDTILAPAAADADNTNSAWNLDIVSNGFKLRTSYYQGNESAATYIYMAFAENPMKHSLAR